MSTDLFEEKLSKLRSGFRYRWFEADLFNNKHLKRKQLYLYDHSYTNQNDPTIKGALVKVTPYFWPLMPEFSILGHKDQVIYEQNVPVVSRDQFDKDGRDLLAKTVQTPFIETVRGWRTVLRVLFQSRILTKEEIIREFGDSDREDWKFMISGTKDKNPWLQV